MKGCFKVLLNEVYNSYDRDYIHLFKKFIQYLIFYDTAITVFFSYTLGEGECLPLAYSYVLYIIFYLMISVSSVFYNNMPVFIWVLIESIIVPKSNDNSPFSSSIPNIVLDRFRFWDSSHMVVVQVQTRKSSLAIGEAQSRGNASVSGLYKKGESTHGLGSRKEPSAHAEEV